MSIRPMVSALTRHRASVVILVLEIALTFAVVSNAFALIMQRVARLQLRTGLDDGSHLVYVNTAGTDRPDAGAIYATILDALRRIPGVQSAAAVNTVPFGPREWTAGFYLDTAEKHFGRVADFYYGAFCPGHNSVASFWLMITPPEGGITLKSRYALESNSRPAIRRTPMTCR